MESDCRVFNAFVIHFAHVIRVIVIQNTGLSYGIDVFLVARFIPIFKSYSQNVNHYIVYQQV